MIMVTEPIKNGARAATPEELPCTSCVSDLWNVKIGQNNLWTGPKELFAKITKKQIF